MPRLSVRSIRNGELTGDDRPGARQLAAIRQPADEREHADEDRQLQHIASSTRRQHTPEQPEDRLPDTHRPDRAIEIAPLVALALGRRLHTGQPTCRTEHPDDDRQRIVAERIHRPDIPDPGDDRHHEPGAGEHAERHDRTPGERVANPAIKRVGPILGKTDDVRTPLAPGEPASNPGYTGRDQNHTEPDRHSPIEPALEEVEGERPRHDEEDKDPDRPVTEPVIQLVPVADFTFTRQLNRDAVCGGAFRLLNHHAGLLFELRV